MKYFNLLIVLALLSASLLSACGPAAAPEEEVKPITLEPIAGTNRNHLTLTEEAAERLGLETVPVVAQQVDGADRLVIPYAALLYDPTGQTWVCRKTSRSTRLRPTMESAASFRLPGALALTKRPPPPGRFSSA